VAASRQRPAQEFSSEMCVLHLLRNAWCHLASASVLLEWLPGDVAESAAGRSCCL